MTCVILTAGIDLSYVILNHTTVGAYIHALGNNPGAARFSGISVNRHLTLVYVISGTLSALAGMILIVRLNSAQPMAGLGFELDAIAAPVLD
jgi:ribose transport system permease protein